MTPNRFDRSVRIVMWADAFLSVAAVAVCIVTTPLVAALGLPSGWSTAVALTSGIAAVLLGIFGPIYAVLLMLRMRRGDYLLPPDLRLPLPPGMRPELTTAATGQADPSVLPAPAAVTESSW